MPIEQCPTIRPTPEEFNDFYRFTHWLDRTFKHRVGMVKVVPPEGWRASLPNYQAALERLDVAHPIEQNVQGTAGFFEARNIVQPKMTLRAYQKYAERQSASVSTKTAEEKERLFWKTIMYSPPIYGADLTGTLMGEGAGEWNMNSLHSLLSYAMPYRVRGVTEPYCYIGAWKAFFSWHKEDLDLSAINYIHQGHPKIWYSIAPEDGPLLEAAARKRFPSQHLQCPQFLRHKTFLINPEALLKEYPELRISKAVHQAGEIMLVFGGAYHQGFNCGFNIAQAVNYATLDWLKQLPNTKSCSCSRKTVRTEVESVLYNLEQSDIYEQLLATEEFMQLRACVQQRQQEEPVEQVETIKKANEINLVDPQYARKIKIIQKQQKKLKKRRQPAQYKPKNKQKPKQSKKVTQVIDEYKPVSSEILPAHYYQNDLDETKKSGGILAVHDQI